MKVNNKFSEGMIEMSLQLDNKTIEISPEIQSLALYGYAIFSSFIATKANNNWKIKGLELHLSRLERDSKAIFSLLIDKEKIKQEIINFLSLHIDQQSIIVRVTLFPKNFSLAKPEKIVDIHILISARTHHVLKNNSLKLTVINEHRVFAQYKTTNMMANLHVRAIAHNHGFDDGLMSVDGLITEGATWNIFFFDGKNLITPDLSNNLLLPGVTRQILISNSTQYGITVLEKQILASDLKNYKAAFITNSAIGVATVSSIDDIIFNQNNTITKIVLKSYNTFPDSIL